MSLITLQDIRFDFGREPILDGAGFNLERGRRYALVGANGAGKSTLLDLLAGRMAPLSGTVERSGGLRVAYLEQETTLDTGDDIDLYERTTREAFPRETALERELQSLGEAISALPAGDARAAELGTRQGVLQQEFEGLDGYTWRARMEAALTGLGLGPDAWRRGPMELSGGQRRRAALAAALLRRCDLLLLDEPTNHLDLSAIEWLESRLAGSGPSLVVVSHDRWFLDRVADRTLHLTRGRVRPYSGGYSFFVQASAERRRRDEKAWKRQQAETARTEDFIRRNLAGQKTKQAQSRRRQLEKQERLARPSAERDGPPIRLDFERASGANAIETRDLVQGYGGETLIRDFSVLIGRGRRVGVIGPNGCGKTTLLRIMAGRGLPDAGHVDIGHNVDLGFHDQQLRGVTDAHTVIEELSAAWPGASLGELRSFAGAFGFGADMIDRSVGRLSGGERSRLALMRLMRAGCNTLLLDEPTNHLDAPSCEALESALRDFAGTLVVVSHDRRFLERVVDMLIVFDEDAGGPCPSVFDGTYPEWRRKRDEAGPAIAPTAGRPSRTRRSERSPGLSKNEIERRRRKIAAAETEIASLEERQAELMAALEDPALSPDDRLRVSGEFTAIGETLSATMADWERWQEEIDAS